MGVKEWKGLSIWRVIFGAIDKMLGYNWNQRKLGGLPLSLYQEAMGGLCVFKPEGGQAGLPLSTVMGW